MLLDLSLQQISARQRRYARGWLGQTLTFSPVADYSEVEVGDMAFIDWSSHGGTYMFHVVHQIDGDQFLIANSLGKINGWVHGSALIGRVTKIVEPEPRPEQREILERLRQAYDKLATEINATPSDRNRLKSIGLFEVWWGR